MQMALENTVRFPQLLHAQLLQDLPESLKRSFLNDCEVRTFSAPKAFIEQGQCATGVFLIAHGSAEVSRLNSSGQNAFMFHSEPGSCIGDLEAIAEKESIASCTANKDTVLLYLPRAKFVKYLTNLQFVKNLALIFLERLQYNNSFRSIDRLEPVDIRLKSYLNFMSGKKAIVDKSQAELASIICCSRQTINKELGKLRDQGVIEMHSGQVIILDCKRLAEGIDQS